MALRLWSSVRHSTQTAVPSARWVTIPSSCQQAFGASYSNLVIADLGRLPGCATTRPRRTSALWIVETAGSGSTPSRRR
jgi:hypothetical protein